MKAKRFLALILALVMALSLVACGDSGKTPAADGDSNSDGDSSFPKMTWTAATSGAEGSNFDVVWRSSASCCRRRPTAL